MQPCGVKGGSPYVVPEGVDLDRLARAGCDDPVIHLRVHPGQLHRRLAGREQSVARILPDPVPRAGAVKSDDLLERRVEIFEESVVVVRGRVVCANRLEVPERRIDGVVFGVVPSRAKCSIARSPSGSTAPPAQRLVARASVAPS